MKGQILIIFASALITHYGSTRILWKGMGNPEHITVPGFIKLIGSPVLDLRDMDERSTSEDDRICFFLNEKDIESQISCKHRLTRSRFNYNPFGLRFGKRNGRLKPGITRIRKLLPVLLFVRELDGAL